MSKEILFPHMADGGTPHFVHSWSFREDKMEWGPRKVFEGKIKVADFARGRSAAYFLGTDSDGAQHCIFIKDLMGMLPYMVRGVVRGKFQQCKRGENFGIQLVIEKPLKKPLTSHQENQG